MLFLYYKRMFQIYTFLYEYIIRFFPFVYMFGQIIKQTIKFLQMEGPQKQLTFNFSKSQKRLTFDLTTQYIYQQNTIQKNTTVFSPKQKIDQILNSLNNFKVQLKTKHNPNSIRASEIFPISQSQTLCKEQTQSVTSGKNSLNSIYTQDCIKQETQYGIKCKNMKLKQKNSCDTILSSSRNNQDFSQLNRNQSQFSFNKDQNQFIKIKQFQQRNMLKSSSSQSDLFFTAKQKKTSLELMKQKLLKFGIKMNKVDKRQISSDKNISIDDEKQNKKFPDSQNIKMYNKIPKFCQTDTKPFRKGSQTKLFLKSQNKSQFFVENSLQSVRQKQFVLKNLKPSQSLRMLHINKNSQIIQTKKVSDNSLNSVKSLGTQKTLNQSGTQQQFLRRQKSLSKIGEPKFLPFKNNKTSQIISPSNLNQEQQKKLQNDELKNIKINDRGLTVSSFLQINRNLSGANGTVKQNCELKQTMQTQYVYPTPKKQLSIEDFKLVRQIGKGKFGQVFLAIHVDSGFLCAIKIMKKQIIRKQRNLQQLIREIKIQSFLNHCNSVKLYSFFDDKEKIYLIIEYCTDGQLFNQLKIKQKFTQKQAMPIIKDISQGLNNFHSHHIIHRDIKPQNIVLSFGMAKICDFGWSVNCRSEKRQTFCGTPLYVSPELLLGKSYDYKVDVWALGILSFQLLTGKLPFHIMSEKQLKKIVTNIVEYPDYMSEKSQDFIKHLLQKNPSYRNDMETILKHRFLTQKIKKP